VEWDSTSWQDFEQQLIEYRDREFVGRSQISGENAYLHLYRELAGVRMADRVSHVDSLVLFLNRWNCHFPTKTTATRVALEGWMGREQAALSTMAGASLVDGDLPQQCEEFDRLYDSLISLRDPTKGARIPTMGDAAASKILHVLVPPLFVMWDRKIKKKAGSRYGEFMLRMHEFALHLRDTLAPQEARGDIDGYLQRVLRYPVRKPLAKYIDEYNSWLAREGDAPSWPASLTQEGPALWSCA
jgi:hypothetical protein